MIRAIYRWHIQPGKEEAFVSAWMEGTQCIRAHVRGAHGSLLLRNHGNPLEFIAIARWESLHDWQTLPILGCRTSGRFTASQLLVPLLLLR